MVPAKEGQTRQTGTSGHGPATLKLNPLRQQIRDFLVVTIGRGVGLGIVANGQVYRGARGGGDVCVARA